MVLLFCCRLTQVVLEKRLLNKCSVVVAVVVVTVLLSKLAEREQSLFGSPVVDEERMRTGH